MASFASRRSSVGDAASCVSQQLYTKVGIYHGSTVAVKYTGQTILDLNNKDLEHLRDVSIFLPNRRGVIVLSKISINYKY